MAELDSGGASGDGDTTDTTNTTDDDPTNRLVLEGLGIGWIANYEDVLKAFGKQPVQFVAGAVFTLILGGVESIVAAFLAAVLAVGDSVAAVPTLTASVLTDAGSVTGQILFETIRAINEPLLTAAQAAGPLAPVVGAAILVGEVIVVLWVGRIAVRLLLDLIPGIGGLA